MTAPSFHFQNSPNDWPAAVAKLPANAMTKLLFGVERARESKAANQNVKTWYRWIGDQPLPHDNFEQHCREWLNQFVDGTFRREAEHVDYIQGYNETLANSQPTEERNRWIALHTAMAKVWHDEYRQEEALQHIRIILCETAIGNDIPWQIAEASEKYDAILGWHPYIVCRVGKITRNLNRLSFMLARYDAPRAKFRGGGLYRMRETVDDSIEAMQLSEVFKNIAIDRPDYISPHDWQWYSGRWVTMDAEYKARGITVDWAFGEGGPVLDASEDWSGWLDPLGGWKHGDCLGGDLGKYKQALTYWLENATQTPAYNEGRLLGLQLFTSGAPGGSGGQWGNFDLIGDDMQQIAEFSGSYDYPPTDDKPAPIPPKPDPVPPPVNDCRGEPRIQYPRTYLAVPQGAEWNDYLSVARPAFENKQTLGFSYDDGGIGDLDSKTVICYGLDVQERGTMADWYFKNYPSTIVVFRSLPEAEPPADVVIDVSHWQGDMDWGKAAANGVTHAYIKATEGDDFTDPAFARNWAEAKANGIIRGAYHFWRNHSYGSDQADLFIEQLGNDIGELPPALDVEDTDGRPETDDLIEWLEIVKNVIGVQPVIYTSPGYWNSHVDASVWQSDYPLWVAHWTDDYGPTLPTGWDDWYLWQYTNAGNGADYGAQSVHMDLNRFNA